MKKEYSVSIVKTRTIDNETKESTFYFEFEEYKEAFEFYIREAQEEAEICSLLSSYRADAVIKMSSQAKVMYRVKISN